MEFFPKALKQKENFYDVLHFEANNFSHLEEELILKTHGICFYQGKIILVKDKGKDFWVIPGGTKEKNETIQDSFTREIKEETNCRVIKMKPLSYQKVQLDFDRFFYRVQYICKVEKIGPFENDPGGNVEQVMLVDPKEAFKYLEMNQFRRKILTQVTDNLNSYQDFLD